MESGYNIRKAVPDDMDKLIKLRIDYLTIDMGGLKAEDEAVIKSQLVNYIAKNINQTFIAYFAEVDKKVVSTAFLAISEKPANPHFITGKTGTLLNVLTYPEYRRKGLASKVIKRIIEEARQLGVSYIELSASEEGKPVYEKLGFSEIKSKYTAMRLQLTDIVS